jgi:hypothetical protein
MYLILICAFASGIIFILGTEEISTNINYKTLANTHNYNFTTPAPSSQRSSDPIAIYSGLI